MCKEADPNELKTMIIMKGKNTMKKIICIVLALVMVMGLATTAFAAAESNTFTIKLTGSG